VTAQVSSAATVTTAGAVITILTDPSDWREPVTRAARLAAATGRKLKVVVADGGELMAAASLACARLMAPGGVISTFEPREARRLLKSQTTRLRLELEQLARRLGIEAELVEPAAAATVGLWTGCTALTVFGRRRRGVIMVVHAGSAATLEVAARLAAEHHQHVRLLRVGPGAIESETVRRLLGPWLEPGAATLGPDAPLPEARGVRVSTLVLDPVYVEGRKLELEALLHEVRRLMQLDG
jgi:hypothetical protein